MTIPTVFKTAGSRTIGASRRTFLRIGTLGLAAAALQAMGFGCGGENGASVDKLPSDLASTWFEHIYDVVKAERTPPPQASRIYGITAVGLYEAVVAGSKKNQSLVGQLSGLKSIPRPGSGKHYWPAVANSALASTIRGLYATISQPSREAIDALEQRLSGQQAAVVSQSELDRSVRHGRTVAAAILEWASADGFSSISAAPYVPIDVPGAWRPTPPQFNANPLEPRWGELRPMVLRSGAEIPASGHVTFSTNPAFQFYAAALEVYSVGRGLTAQQKVIADYWADGPGATGTPSGHWIALVSQVSRNDALSLMASAEAYARVGIAVHDAFICCWHAKYVFNLQRPVTYINDNMDASWLSYIATPNFPAYTSGHSTQSGAAAAVLTAMFGVKSFRDTTHADHGLTPGQEPRTFKSFDEASAEAAVSRLYGGIHYGFDNNDGLVAGQAIGRAIGERVRFRSG